MKNRWQLFGLKVFSSLLCGVAACCGIVAAIIMIFFMAGFLHPIETTNCLREPLWLNLMGCFAVLVVTAIITNHYSIRIKLAVQDSLSVSHR